MRNINIRGLYRAAFVGFFVAILPLSGLAQEQEQQDLFKQVIPNPTGKNGYEEFVMACALLKQSEWSGKAQLPEATLTTKRRMLEEPVVVRALSMFRKGLKK